MINSTFYLSKVDIRKIENLISIIFGDLQLKSNLLKLLNSLETSIFFSLLTFFLQRHLSGVDPFTIIYFDGNKIFSSNMEILQNI